MEGRRRGGTRAHGRPPAGQPGVGAGHRAGRARRSPRRGGHHRGLPRCAVSRQPAGRAFRHRGRGAVHAAGHGRPGSVRPACPGLRRLPIDPAAGAGAGYLGGHPRRRRGRRPAGGRRIDDQRVHRADRLRHRIPGDGRGQSSRLLASAGNRSRRRHRRRRCGFAGHRPRARADRGGVARQFDSEFANEFASEFDRGAAGRGSEAGGTTSGDLLDRARGWYRTIDVMLEHPRARAEREGRR